MSPMASHSVSGTGSVPVRLRSSKREQENVCIVNTLALVICEYAAGKREPNYTLTWKRAVY